MTAALSRATGWLALSDHPFAGDGGDPDSPLPQATFTLEMALPIAQGPVLLDVRSDTGLPRVFSIFHDPAVGLLAMQRQGDRLVRHVLPGPIPDMSGTARLSYAWDMAADRWTLTLTLPQGGVLTAAGDRPMAPRLSDLILLCRPGSRRHPSVLWFGITRDRALPDPGPWIGAATPVLTDRGLCPAGQLRPGDRIGTADSGWVPLLALHRVVAPSRGTCAPVLLRAAYFQTRTDVLVSSEQPVAFSGPAVDYLFGEDEVLVAAGHLVDGRAALWDDRRGVALGLSLDLGAPELVLCDGVAMPSRIAPGLISPRRVLTAYEAMPLLSLKDTGLAVRQRI